MIYNQLNLQNQDFVNQSVGNSPKIVVEYNGTGIHNITGPVPVVDISYSFNNNGNNLPESFTTNVTLNGKILRWPEGVNIVGVDTDKAMPGFSGIIAGVTGLRDLFSNCPYGVLKFKCENNVLHEISGLRVTDISINNTDDNWAQTADYQITLEGSTRLFGNQDDPNSIERFVTERTDTWNIEPLDDNIYTQFEKLVTGRYEYSNPKLERRLNPLTNLNTFDAEETGPLQIINIPQFRITRRLSAKGVVKPSGADGEICRSELYNENTKPYVFAKAWVEDMSLKGFKSVSTPNNSAPYFKNPFNNNLFAFNHNRTINIDIYNGTYETNDTWLAMPSGVPYTETYTLETSTGEDYIRTVRVAGNIVGLSITDQSLMTNSGVLVSGTGNNGIIDAELRLDAYNKNGQSLPTNYSSLDEKDSPTPTIPKQSINSIKYNNALNAWLNHIKPYLYRRACLAVRSEDRKNNGIYIEYVPPYKTDPPSIPNNPIYSKERLLSTIPIGTSEGHDPRKGTINYSYEYTSRLTIISGVISENINVSYDNPNDATSETQVIGRALGPIVQRTGRSTPKKTISVEIAIMPVTEIDQVSMQSKTCPLYKNSYLFKTVEQIIEAHRPYSPSTFLPNEPAQTEGLVYTSSDNEQWSPTTGKYSRSVSWVYQQANIGKDFRDH
jgi:hypothetical protein